MHVVGARLIAVQCAALWLARLHECVLFSICVPLTLQQVHCARGPSRSNSTVHSAQAELRAYTAACVRTCSQRGSTGPAQQNMRKHSLCCMEPRVSSRLHLWKHFALCTTSLQSGVVSFPDELCACVRWTPLCCSQHRQPSCVWQSKLAEKIGYWRQQRCVWGCLPCLVSGLFVACDPPDMQCSSLLPW